MSSRFIHPKLQSLVRQAQLFGSDYYLTQKHFLMTLAAAFLLHLIALYAWLLVPPPKVIDIPVSVLNIKLGDDETVEDIKAVQAGTNKNDVENTISRMIRDEEAQTQRAQELANSTDKAMLPAKTLATKNSDKASAVPMPPAPSKTTDAAKQYVRTGTQAVIRSSGDALGNSSAKNAELMKRYEQLISLWIQKFKLYPDEARAQNMVGETVVRIRIDRQGNIRYYILERSTGYQVLDRAAIDMIRRANPVPAVPVDYPPGDLLEFLIPVNFQIQ